MVAWISPFLGLVYSASSSINSQQINLNYEANQVPESSKAPWSATIPTDHANSLGQFLVSYGNNKEMSKSEATMSHK